MTAAMPASAGYGAVMARGSDDMSQIRKRGNSYQVNVYAGIDPLTGKRLYLSDSSTDIAVARRIRNRFRSEVDEQRNARTKGTVRTAFTEWLKTHDVEPSTRKSYQDYLRLYIGPAFGDDPIGKIKARTLEQFYAELRRCSSRCDGTKFIEHRVDGEHECRVVKHKRRPGRPPASGYPQHDCAKVGCAVTECKAHVCKPLSNSTISKVHFALSGAFAAAVRWEWISSNPADVAKKPSQPIPQPKPPTPSQAARIIEAAWEQDEQWGTLVWLVMVTGMRRGEVLALRWSDVDLDAGQLDVRRAVARVDGELIEKDTKTHQMRLISLDDVTVEVLTEHRAQYEDGVRELGVQATDDALLFSYDPTYGRLCDPDAVTHRYGNLCSSVDVDSHLHALRHYSATELLTAGVDLRTVAGRLGHGGGGATTLRVYAAWVGESDRRAAEILGSRMKRPGRSVIN